MTSFADSEQEEKAQVAGRDDAAGERAIRPLLFCSDSIFTDVINSERKGGECVSMFSTGVPFVQAT